VYIIYRLLAFFGMVWCSMTFIQLLLLTVCAVLCRTKGTFGIIAKSFFFIHSTTLQ